jgi:hypothetical protein
VVSGNRIRLVKALTAFELVALQVLHAFTPKVCIASCAFSVGSAWLLLFQPVQVLAGACLLELEIAMTPVYALAHGRLRPGPHMSTPHLAYTLGQLLQGKRCGASLSTVTLVHVGSAMCIALPVRAAGCRPHCLPLRRPCSSVTMLSGTALWRARCASS